MTTTLHARRATSGGWRWRAIASSLFGLIFAATVSAQAPAAPGTAASAPAPEILEKLVAPIALYPDDLVAIILPAATNPLQLVQADRFLEKRKSDPKLPVEEKWDDAVKSLLNYPEIVKTMAGDLDWTAALGEAVVADQGAVLEAVQVFRRKTQAVGNLKTDSKQVVVVEKEVIKIVPADPQVIYVPQYNPTTVVVAGGYSSWGYWPSPYPVYYYPYPPGAAFAAGLVWGAAIGAAWNGNHYVTHYGRGGTANINVNRNVNISNVNVNRPVATPRATASTTQWSPNKQPGQVSGTVGPTATARVGEARTGTGAATNAAARPPSQPAAAARPAMQPAAAGQASRSAAPSATSAGAFDGYSSGRQAQLDSSRGASSRSTMASAGIGGGVRGGRR